MTQTEIRLSGSGGQGLILAARILADGFLRQGRRIAQSQSYEPTSRGGLSRADIVVSDDVPDYPLATALDWLVILDQCAVDASRGMIRDDALVLVDAERVDAPPRGPFRVRALPFVERARALGNERVANIVAIASLVAAGGLMPRELLEEVVRARAPKRFLALNLEALAAGFALAGEAAADAKAE
ncbi:MAG TPA: pyruvate ferredoxin oxidoreductase [Thermopetrobacter sp.]|nr:pyruvate ferredoxin oxidoreductase [Thermopetrobacter sp.]